MFDDPNSLLNKNLLYEDRRIEVASGEWGFMMLKQSAKHSIERLVASAEHESLRRQYTAGQDREGFAGDDHCAR